MNKDFFGDILFWIDDMCHIILTRIFRLIIPVGDGINRLLPMQEYKKHKHEVWQKRATRIEDIRRTFCRELKLPEEFHAVFAYNNVLELSDGEFNSLLDGYFTKHLQESKQLGASELIRSSHLPPYIEERL